MVPTLCSPPGRASLHDKASLRIEQVRSEDQGWYECKVLMLDQQYDTFHNGSWVHLTVNGEQGGGCGIGVVPKWDFWWILDVWWMLGLDGICAWQTREPEAIQAGCSSQGVTSKGTKFY